MQTRKFGKTGYYVFEIGIGTYGHSYEYRNLCYEESYEILIDAVSNFPKNSNVFIDVAPLYKSGAIEKCVGEIANETDRSILIGTKGGRGITKGNYNERSFTREFLMRDIESSCKRLGEKNIFLYQLHGPTLKDITEHDLFEFLEIYRERKYFDYYGVSVDTPKEGVKILNFAKKINYSGFAAIQVIYNLLQREAEKYLLKIARENGVAIIAREPLMRGFLTGKYCSMQNEDLIRRKAIKKLVDKFGLENIDTHINRINKTLLDSKESGDILKYAIDYILDHDSVSVVIPGINKMGYSKRLFNLNRNSNTLKLLKRLAIMLQLESLTEI